MQFLILVPILRECELLQQSLGSAILQPGDFDIHVHLQCAEYSTESKYLVERWQQWLKAGKTGRRLTMNVEADTGIYDGIGRAMRVIEPAEDVVMTWLGADDVLLPGALATVQSILSEHPQIEWLTGHRCISAADGSIFSAQGPCYKFRRSHLVRGKHDGRSAPFVMQEGTFWKVGLWNRAGGVTSTLKFAGDWDLWRRFAAIAPLYTVNFSLAKFSRTVGNLSSDMSAYYREVDSLLSKACSPKCADFYTYSVQRRPGETRWKIIRKLDLFNLLAMILTFRVPHRVRQLRRALLRFVKASSYSARRLSEKITS